MSDKQRYYANLERQRAAEASLRSQARSPQAGGSGEIEDLYADMGVRAFAAFQSCLDWLAGLGAARRSGFDGTQVGELKDVLNKALNSTLSDLAEDVAVVKEQLSKVETAIANLEAGMRRIDKYTLDAFQQLAELDTMRAEQTQEHEVPAGNRRLAKDEARKLALEAAQRMAEAGQSLSLASVAREAGLKYGQIVYAFGNKDKFLNELKAFKTEAETEVAVAHEAASAS